MCDYDFCILHYDEFENITRDLLQAEFGIYIESFKAGKDGGIDFRYGLDDSGTCVVQAKRYETYPSLISQLKKEVKKVEKLQPERYILSTSVPLSPAQKDEIKELFGSYIKKTEDIFGKDDLNNLLGKYEKIEERYYKLWISSTAVLNRFIHNDMKNWAKIEMENIQEAASTYVENESFDEAYAILKQYHYVIISGIPGIGKTTLARMLMLRMLVEEKYDDIVNVKGDLDKAMGMLHEGVKQIIFFDDFMGANTFEEGEKGFEGRLIDLIDYVRRSQDKLFIMTTREYILAEAKAHYEKLRTQNYEIAKCVVDMRKYDAQIRAKILRNHIIKANLPDECFRQILHRKNYTKIIGHRYFNPRVIDTYLDREVWKTEPIEQFMTSFIRMFDHPTAVWQQAFDNISREAKYALLVLCTMGKEIPEEAWHKSYKHFCKFTQSELGLNSIDTEWRHILQVLSGCFIRIERLENREYYIELHNPAVRGFIVEYLRQSKDNQRYLIEGAQYVEQLFCMFTNIHKLARIGDAFVELSPDMYELVKKRMVELMTSEEPSYSVEVRRNGKYIISEKMDLLAFFAANYRNDGLMEQLLTKEDLMCQKVSLDIRLSFLPTLDWNEVNFTSDEILEEIFQEQINVEDFVKLIDTMAYIGRMEYTRSKSFLDKLSGAIHEAIDDNIFNYFKLLHIRDGVERIGHRISPKLFNAEEIMVYIDQVQQDLATIDDNFDEIRYSTEGWQNDLGEYVYVDDPEVNKIMQDIKDRKCK